MKVRFLFVGAVVASVVSSFAELKPKSSGWVWFDAPCGMSSGDWENHGLIIGNGRVGAMVMDGAGESRLALNEISFWTGGENPGGNCSGYGYGPKADRNQFGCYQPFGDFVVKFDGLEKFEKFERGLDLSTGIAGCSFAAGGVEYSREAFASIPDEAVIVNYTASKKKSINAVFTLSPDHDAKATAKVKGSSGRLCYSGALANGMKFAATAVVIAEGGTMSASAESADIKVDYEGRGDGMMPKREGVPSVTVKGSDSVRVVITMRTDYALSLAKNWKVEDDPSLTANEEARQAARRVATARERAVKAHQSYFNRCKIDLGTSPASVAALPTPKRIEQYKKSANDPELEATLFQFGRYCLIGCSHGSLPATLQGLWNDKVHPAWACDYHTNINIQEAYWSAEVTNLSDCHLPLFDWLDTISPVSRRITANAYKKADGTPVRGWTTRVSQNPFGAGGWTMWNVPCNAWYALHYWEHYQFTQDRAFLEKRAYPMMKEACEFWEDYLKPLGKDGAGWYSRDGNADRSQLKGLPEGTLVAPNGWSHEWGPVEDGVSHDQQLVRELFDNTVKAAKILKVDTVWALGLAKKRDLLAPSRIAPGGYLQEWLVDRPKMVSGHRHTSHLFAVYPGSTISYAKTPKLADAAKKSLELRGTSGDSRRSWTWPWRCALWARLQDGKKAHEMVEGLLKHNTLSNMLTTHAPFQMDGNFSLPAAISEMLLQSHETTKDGKVLIRLLPALPKAWAKEGSFEGLKARGGYTVALRWKEGKVVEKTIFGGIPNGYAIAR